MNVLILAYKMIIYILEYAIRIVLKKHYIRLLIIIEQNIIIKIFVFNLVVIFNKLPSQILNIHV